jgi:sugar lactone lactonase YvrE
MAYDGTENVSAAYGYYIDDFQWPAMGAIFAEHGSKQSPFAGYYFGRDRISKAAFTMYGNTAPKTRAGIAFHWRTQPVINISEDGRSANLRTRLFHPDTGKKGANGRPDIMSGMYPNDQTVLENGIWRLWSLEIDEPYFTMAGWKGGWSGVQDKPPGSPRPPLSPLVARMAPDILMTELGKRAEGFRGGTGETIEWPGILPMWFNYRNPVSGRVPPRYWPDCVPCDFKPEARMTKYGYQMPPTGPKNIEGVTPAISGVVNEGTPIQLIKDGYEAVEGPIPQPDGGLLFTNNRAHHIEHLAPDGSASVWYQGAGGANALTRTIAGEIAATLTESHAIGVVNPGAAPRVLVSDYEGTPFNRPNDLVASRHGDIYFTDTVPLTASGPAPMPSALYQLTAKGKLIRIADDVARPNGVALSPDERTLYLANTSGEWVYAFNLDEDGHAQQRRDFAHLAMPAQQTGSVGGAGADGLAIDEKGRLYVATTVGVQVFSPEGAPLGIIKLPKQPQNLAFSGPGRKALFIVGRGAVYRIDTLTRGPDRQSK